MRRPAQRRQGLCKLMKTWFCRKWFCRKFSLVIPNVFFDFSSACKLEDRYLNFVVSAEFPLFLMVYVFPFACGLTSHGVEVS